MRAWKLAAWAVVAIALALAVWRVRFSDDLRKLLPENEPRLQRQLAFFTGRGVSEILALWAWSDDEAQAPKAAARLRALVAELAPLGATPVAGDAGDFAVAAERILERLPELVTPEELDAAAPRMAGAPLRDWLRTIKERAARPEEQLAGSAVRDDVLGLTGAVFQSLRGHLPKGRPAGGLLVSVDDPRHVMALLSVSFAPSDLARTRPLLECCDAASAAAAADGVHLETVGSYRHYRDNLDGIFRDLVFTGPLGIIAVVALLWSLLRWGRDLLALHLPAVIAFLAAIAVLALPNQHAPKVMLGLAACFLGVAVENAIHMTLALQMGEGGHVRRPLIESFLTTAIAFAVLWFSAVPALRVLGLMVVVGLVAALAASLWLLPLLVPRRPRAEPWRGLATRLLQFSEGPPLPRILAAVAVTALLAPGLGRVGFIRDLKRMDGSRPETWKVLEAFEARWRGYDSSDFLVGEGADLDAALRAVRSARQQVGLPFSVVERLLPDEAERRRRIDGWNAFWSAHRDAFATELSAACGEVGLVPAAFNRSLARYQPIADAPELGLATWRDTPLGQMLGLFVDQRDGVWQVTTPAGHLPAAEVEAIADRLDAAHADAWIASRLRMAKALIAAVRDDLAKLGLAMAGAMVLLIALMERSPRRIVAVLVPTGLALVWTFGVLGWLGVPLTPFTVLVGAFIAGIGIDTGVFLASHEHRAAALSPALACAASTALGTASLITADNPMVHDIGIASMVGMAACVGACLLLTPAIAGPRPQPGNEREKEPLRHRRH